MTGDWLTIWSDWKFWQLINKFRKFRELWSLWISAIRLNIKNFRKIVYCELVFQTIKKMSKARKSRRILIIIQIKDSSFMSNRKIVEYKIRKRDLLL